MFVRGIGCVPFSRTSKLRGIHSNYTRYRKTGGAD